MKLKFDYNNMMESSIGSHGVKQSEIDKANKAHDAAYKEVIENSGKGWQEWTDTPLIGKSEIDELNAFRKKALSSSILSAYLSASISSRACASSA